MTDETSAQETKLSRAFLEFAEPLWKSPPGSPVKPQVLQRALQLSYMVWNAVVLDTVCGTSEHVARLLERLAEEQALVELAQAMVVRKKTFFDADHRAIIDFQVKIQEDGFDVTAQGVTLSRRAAGEETPPGEKLTVEELSRKLRSLRG